MPARERRNVAGGKRNKQRHPWAATCRKLCGASTSEGLSEKLNTQSLVWLLPYWSCAILYYLMWAWVSTSNATCFQRNRQGPGFLLASPMWNVTSIPLITCTTIQGTAVFLPSCWPPSHAHQLASLSILSRSLNFGALLISLRPFSHRRHMAQEKMSMWGNESIHIRDKDLCTAKR